jgi:hypothetical protein
LSRTSTVTNRANDSIWPLSYFAEWIKSRRSTTHTYISTWPRPATLATTVINWRSTMVWRTVSFSQTPEVWKGVAENVEPQLQHRRRWLLYHPGRGVGSHDDGDDGVPSAADRTRLVGAWESGPRIPSQGALFGDRSDHQSRQHHRWNCGSCRMIRVERHVHSQLARTTERSGKALVERPEFRWGQSVRSSTT